MAAPVPPLLRPERIPRGPQVRYEFGIPMEEARERLVRALQPRVIVRGYKLSIAQHWICDRCGATGTGCVDDGFAHEEVEHCLSGCNGSLRATVSPRNSAPSLPEADLSLNGLPLAK